MKRLLIATFSLITFYGFSQNKEPVFKTGTKLTYEISTDNGSIPLTIIIESLSPSQVKLRWSASQAGTGVWKINEKSLQTATTGRWSQLEPDSEVTLPDDQSVVIFSKAQWLNIQKNKKVEMDMVSYTIKKNSQPMKLNNKDVDCLYLENEDGTSKLWILNNAAFPAVLKISGNKAGADAELKSVE